MNDDFNLVKLLNAIRLNIIYLIFICSVIFLSCLLYFLTAERVYKVSSMIKIDEDSSDLALDFTGIGTSTINLDEEIFLYKSYSNMAELVKTLKLDVMIELNETTYKYNESSNPLKIDSYNFSFENIFSPPIVLTISPKQDSFDILDSDKNMIIKNASFNELMELPNGYLVVSEINIDSDFDLIFSNTSSIIRNVSDSINLEPSVESQFSWDRGTLLSVSTRSPDTILARELIDTANEIFRANDLIKKSAEADRSLGFIDEQLDISNKKLEKSEIELNNFQKNYGTLNVDLEIEGLINQVTSLKESLRSIRMKKVELESRYSQDNIAYQSILSQEDELTKQLEEANSQISSLPETQQEYISLFGEVEINKRFTNELISKKLEISIIKASTLGRVQIIDDASVRGKISPSGTRALILFIFLSSLSSIIFIYIRTYLFTYFRYPSQITEEFKDVEVTGVLPLMTDDEINNKELKMQKYELLVSSILYDCNKSEEMPIIQITGATSSLGKSTIAVGLSQGFARIGKKTLLLDLDFRRGTLHKVFDSKKLKNLDIYRDISKINDYRFDENLYVIPSKKIGDNLDFVSFSQGHALDNFFEKAKEIFDIVLIDSTPCLRIPDALSVSRYASHIYGVIRHNDSSLADLKAMKKIFEKLDRPLNGLIYNAFKEEFLNYYSSDYYTYNYSSKYDYYGKNE